ncbi:MAG TPA: hypothetical protein VHM28_12100, partial [Anaerolineales bacterium]|nr:hypothetical protein [Anaerolineales bacterium]
MKNPKKRNATTWKKGQSGNLQGRPRDGESWSSILRAIGGMDRDELLDVVGRRNELGRAIAKFPRKVQMKYLVAARAYASLIATPNASLWTSLMERAEGKVKEPAQSEGSLSVENLMDALKKVYG